MSPSFDKAIDTVLEHEGGFVNHRDDPGGATNYGISLRTVLQMVEAGDLKAERFDVDGDGDIDVDDIRALNVEAAEEIYFELWWQRNQYDRIDDQDIATKVFDFAVNMGSRQAHKLLQRACRACGWTLVDDGLIGPNSIRAINSVRPAVLLAAFKSEAAGFYRALTVKNEAFESFIDGWLIRAYS